MCWLLHYLALPLALNLIAGLVSAIGRCVLPRRADFPRRELLRGVLAKLL